MRIVHLSVVVDAPERVARILAELSHGRVESFRTASMSGAWVCMWGGDQDELIEFIPKGYLMCPAAEGVDFRPTTTAHGYNSTHVQLEVDVMLGDIRAIADAHGCRHSLRRSPRLGGPLYDVWIEDEFLVELASDEIRATSQAG